MNPCIRWMGVLTAATACIAAAAGPPVAYLRPDSFAGALNEPVLVRVELGSALSSEVAAWPAERLKHFYVLTDATRENRDTVPAAARDPNATEVVLTQPGVSVIGLDQKPQVIRVPAEDLKAFLTRNVADAVQNPAVQRLSGQQEVRVRHVQSAATMVRVRTQHGERAHSGAAQTKTGQAVEIRPLFDPTMLVVDADFPVRVYVEGAKQEGVKVQATSLTARQTTDKTADATGATHFRITHPGVWRIEFHTAQPLTGDAEADWVIYSATLTFEVAGEGVQK